jgi:Cof subfamily protein (haloacid dehalogenase superfamily)
LHVRAKTDLPDGILPGGRFATWSATKPQFVALDVDGTLVGATATPRQAVSEAITAAQHAGVQVGIVTGRMRHAVTGLIGTLGLSGPHVFHNGAEVALNDGTTLSVLGLDDAAVAHLFRVAATQTDVVGEFYCDDTFFVTRVDPRSEAHWQILDARPNGTLPHVDALSGLAVRKVTLTAFSATAARAMEHAVTAHGLTAGTATSPQTPNLTYVNATHASADKGFGVQTIANQLHVPVEACVMIGDESNDLPAFAVAGTAIAMGQAEAHVKDQAHLIVPDVHRDGVAHALNFLCGGTL